MSRIVGAIDRLRRPVIRLETPAGDSFLALVDTGFNGELMLSEADATSLGFTVSRVTLKVMLAGDTSQTIKEGSGQISWFGTSRKVNLIVNPTSHLRRMDDDPIALVGTRLLTPHLLLIDFEASTLEIESQN